MQSATATAIATATTHHPISVMLVDDHQTMLWGLSRLIDGEQPRMRVVGTADDCDQALAGAGRLRPDVILLDLDLHGRSALDILPQLLSNHVSRALVLTGERDPQLLDQAVLRGARGVMRKDVPAQDVLRAIERVHSGEYWLDVQTMGRVFNELMASCQAPRPANDAAPTDGLTPTERKVVRAVVEGRGASNKVLAERLFVTEHTLRNHLSAIYQKLGVANRLELYVHATRQRA